MIEADTSVGRRGPVKDVAANSDYGNGWQQKVKGVARFLVVAPTQANRLPGG
jgi:hypothetical protein